MSGKRVLVTGATAGIGYETAKAIASMGAELIIVGRNEAKTKGVVDELKRASGNQNVTFLIADLSLMSQVRALAKTFLERYDRLDVLVNNAGAVMTKREVTSEGFELTFATNHLSYFLLTNLLVPALEKAKAARVVCVASDAHRTATLDFSDLMSERYSAFAAYSRSKLANILFAREAARRFAAKGIVVNSLHPGVVASNFIAGKPGLWGVVGKIASVFMISNEAGAKTSVFLATSAEVEGVSGKYFDKSKAREPSAAAVDDGAAARLWAESARLTGLDASGGARPGVTNAVPA